MDSLRSQFLLDPSVVFLNHGSFGACPRPVFDEYQRWQRELERQPVEFLGRRANDLLAEARAALAAYLGAPPDDLVYFPNPTTAVNMVARSLALGAGDEILTTDHEYGAMDRTWRFVCGKTGAQYVRRAMPVPLTTADNFIDAFWAGVTERTRLIFLSHLTSPTALIFPVAAICRRARAAGILTVVDGAHAPGQLPLDLTEVGADIYVGACHKWLMAPKGAAFLYARPELQAQLEPLVVSWGWENETPGPSPFIDFHEWQGTRDLAAFLTVPAAIRFQAEQGWEQVRAACHALVSETRARANALTGLEALCPDSPAWFGQMATIRLPKVDSAALKVRLYDEFRVEVPLVNWNGADFVRVSFQGYNTRADMETLLKALEVLLPATRKT
jgi:isopenicillin-N epimerase